MARALKILLVLAIGAGFGSMMAWAQMDRGFGFGGPMAVAFFPDLSGVNVFLSENGLAPFGDFLLGGGGIGRGGVIGGPAAGGIGWGVVAESEKEDRHAELVFGGGGVDLGAAIGGDDSSVLTVGGVFGGGAMILEFFAEETEPSSPAGLVIEPTVRTIGRAIGFVEPYVSMEAQLLKWLGLELRVGYVLPAFGIPFGDELGVPAPSLLLSGPMVSLGLVFGGIGIPEPREAEEPSGAHEVTAVSEGTLPVEPGQVFAVENEIGDIMISAYGEATTQTPSGLVVEWQATRTCLERHIEGLQAVSETTDAGVTLKTVGRGRVDYVIRVPSGIDLTVRNRRGNVSVRDHEGQTIIIETGVGDVDLQGVHSAALIVAAGVGRVDLPDVEAQTLIAELGIGEIALTLPEDASADVTARARLGNVSIDRFPGMIGGVRGFLGKSGDVRLGDGERTAKLSVSVGEIRVEMRAP